MELSVWTSRSLVDDMERSGNWKKDVDVDVDADAVQRAHLLFTVNRAPCGIGLATVQYISRPPLAHLATQFS